jgi:2,3-bisphosphoglycerate-independent phosphoglycerate mutase
MVGHTGVMEAAVKAVETVDSCVQKVVEATLARQGTVLITSDHGNAEKMVDEANAGAMTSHTTYDVDLIFISENIKIKSLNNGVLADIAPTMLKLLGIEQPKAMTGKNLLEMEN